jgi:hypothetical protein
MDNQKLAKTLLRVLSIWLFAQSITQLSSGFYTTYQLAGHNVAWTGYRWGTILPGFMTLMVGWALFLASGRLSIMITGNHSEAKA